ncbi:MAG: ribosome-associated translation inhibitor RaiA [Candidatus Paceibacterota bacterium]
MKLIIHTKNIDLTPSIRALVEDKVGSVEKFIKPENVELAEARVEVGKPSQHHKSGMIYYAEINLKIGSRLLRAEAEHMELEYAVVEARKDLERQIKKGKQKKREVRRVQKRV